MTTTFCLVTLNLISGSTKAFYLRFSFFFFFLGMGFSRILIVNNKRQIASSVVFVCLISCMSLLLTLNIFVLKSWPGTSHFYSAIHEHIINQALSYHNITYAFVFCSNIRFIIIKMCSRKSVSNYFTQRIHQICLFVWSCYDHHCRSIR